MIKLLRSAQNVSRALEERNVQVGATSSDTLTLTSTLAACVSYPTSDAALRMAMREQLNLAEVIIPILAILDDWLVTLSSHGTSLILNAKVGNVGGNGPSVEVLTRPCSGKVEIPPLDKVSPMLLLNTDVDSAIQDIGISTRNSRRNIRDVTTTHRVSPTSPTRCFTSSI